MTSRFERSIDETLIDALLTTGYLRLGPSRSHLAFEHVVLEHEASLLDPNVQLEFRRLCDRLGTPGSSSKIDYQPPSDPRGHKLSIQFDFDDAEAVLWARSVSGIFVDLAEAAVHLVGDDVRRSPIRSIFRDLPLRSTVRAIVYYPGVHPGVHWHTDPCLLQFISIPTDDASLYVSPYPLVTTEEIASLPGAKLVRGGSTPETVLLPGGQMDALRSGAGATVHAVACVADRRAVATHFVWLGQGALGTAPRINFRKGTS